MVGTVWFLFQDSKLQKELKLMIIPTLLIRRLIHRGVKPLA